MHEQKIHPTAIIHPETRIGQGVEIGPYCVIEEGVTLGDRCKLWAHVHIQGTTTLGEDNVVMSGAALGFPPQYMGFDGSATPLVIGDRNTFRENVTINRGLSMDSATTIGDDCMFMANAHVAHDCHVGNRVIMANCTPLGGHVSVGDGAFISGVAAVHQFCRIGTLAMIGGVSKVVKDVPPFSMVDGNPARVRGLNIVGLRRAGFHPHVRKELKRLMRQLYEPGVILSQVLATINPIDLSDQGKAFIEFYRTSKRGVTASSQTRSGE